MCALVDDARHGGGLLTTLGVSTGLGIYALARLAGLSAVLIYGSNGWPWHKGGRRRLS